MHMSIKTFFYEHPIFRYEEFLAWYEQQGSYTHLAVQKALQYYTKSKALLHIRRGIYATVPPTVQPADLLVDTYLLAGKATDDSIIAYHTALELHGVAYLDFNNLTFVTAKKSKSFEFRVQWFHPVAPPKALERYDEIGVMKIERQGVNIFITTPERTFVDVIDRVSLSGGWEEVVRSINKMAVLNINEVIRYCLMLNNRTLAAKVGFFLEQRRGAFMVDQIKLNQLLAFIPAIPQYIADRRSEVCRLVKKWNLMIPVSVLNQSWEEPHHDV